MSWRRAACATSDLVVMDCQYYQYMREPPVSLPAASLRLAGHVGQVTLDRLQDAAVASLADFDQHVAAVRAELTAACQLPPAAGGQQVGLAAGRRATRAPGRRATGRRATQAATPVPAAGSDASCPDVPFVRSALCAEQVLPRHLLLHYACGFIEAALGSDWRPSETRRGSDWESMRLAAVCHLVKHAETAAALHPDLRALA
jgi:hypothetical protein